MRLVLKYTVFSILCCLFSMSSAVWAQKGSDKGVEVTFPEIEGWEKGDTTTYPTAELGYSVSYQSEEGAAVTIYLYNLGIRKIADGIDDKNVIAQRNQAKNDIKAFGEEGYYENVKHITDSTVTLGGQNGKVKALYSLFTFKVRGMEVASEIYLFGFKDNFVKIRATRPNSAEGFEIEAVKTVLAEMDKLFAQ